MAGKVWLGYYGWAEEKIEIVNIFPDLVLPLNSRISWRNSGQVDSGVTMKTIAFYILAAFFEIFGCYTFWLWIRLEHSMLWLIPGSISLILFAVALTQIEAQFAGRAFAAYGGIYIASCLVWLRVAERKTPDLWDLTGVTVCLIGAAIILLGPRNVLRG